MKKLLLLIPLVLLSLTGCEDVDDGHNHSHDHEIITTVTLSFTPAGGGDAVEASWTDPELDGDPVIDDITLMDADDYDLRISFTNEQEMPAEDVTEEIADEEDQHQVFVTGSAVQGPATGTNGSAIVEHDYADQDAAGLPLGLENTISTIGAGTGQMTVTLRHMPYEDGSPIKVADLAEDVATGGFGNIGGANDVEVTFNLEVQ